MIKRLTGKGESYEDAAEAVKWLVELGYINDSSYASLIVNHYYLKGYGEARIKNELFKRGIPQNMWEEILSQLKVKNEPGEFEDSPNVPAVEFLQKKLRGSDDKDDLRRAKDALVRRGFSYDEAGVAINMYLTSLSEQSEEVY